jgi:hypothetical protein
MTTTRNKTLKIRLTSPESTTLKARARAAGLTRSEYIRRVAIKGRKLQPVSIDADSLRQIYAELRRQGGNINQIARELNTHHQLDSSVSRHIDSTLAQQERAALLLAELLSDARNGGSA